MGWLATIRGLAVLAAIGACTGTAAAQRAVDSDASSPEGAVLPGSAEAPDRRPRGNVGGRVENDFFGTTDEYYSQGLELSWTGRLAESAPGAGLGSLWLDVRLGQAMYTPRTIWVEEPPEDDRPYAGVLTGRAGLLSVSDARRSGVGLAIGVVGPASGAAEAQELFHETFNLRQPRGWDTQLSNRALVAVELEHADVLERSLGERGAFALMSYGQLHLGTIQRTTTIGGGLHVGYQLDPQASLGLISSVLGAPPGDEPEPFGFGLFVAGLGRLVAHDGLIEGAKDKNTRPDPRRTVAEGRAGLVIRAGRLRVRYAQVVESRSFRSQPGKHVYGEAELSVAY